MWLSATVIPTSQAETSELATTAVMTVRTFKCPLAMTWTSDIMDFGPAR